MEDYPSAPQLCNCMVDKQTMIHQYNEILLNDKEISTKMHTTWMNLKYIKAN